MIATVSGSLPGGPFLFAGTTSHPGLLINAAIAVTVVLGWDRPARPFAARPFPRMATLRPSTSGPRLSFAPHGRDSLDPFALREDKALFFEGDSLLAYRVIRETAVVSGDPVGPPEEPAPLLASFLRFAEQRDWNVVITAASKRYLAVRGARPARP